MTDTTRPDGDDLEKIIDDYLEDYEMIGEDEAGREGWYTPTERERAIAKDAIMGLLAHDEWDAAWGRLVDQRAAEKAALTAPASKPAEGGVKSVIDSCRRRARPPQGRWSDYERGRASAFEAVADELSAALAREGGV